MRQDYEELCSPYWSPENMSFGRQQQSTISDYCKVQHYHACVGVDVGCCRVCHVSFRFLGRSRGSTVVSKIWSDDENEEKQHAPNLWRMREKRARPALSELCGFDRPPFRKPSTIPNLLYHRAIHERILRTHRGKIRDATPASAFHGQFLTDSTELPLNS